MNNPHVKSTAEQPQTSNRLIHEKSPYLLQHARNPVDWHPWGEEAFEKARRENKPILLSIGYSTCHWCHVMEHESFENPEIAALMNKYLVSIKLDREERPDIDKIYMTAVQAMTGSGGWPLNVFLTPDLKPFLGGTYFPPEGRWGRMGWPELVERIGRAWQDPAEREKIQSSGQNIGEALARYLSQPREKAPLSVDVLASALERFEPSFDAENGGFSQAPKFPMPVNQDFLLRYSAFAKSRPELKNGDLARRMALDTLRAMSRGGIYDHIGGGFARYSTDARWHIPHFEKMLYDNAQLALNFLDAYQITREPDFARVARETLDYVRRDMTHLEGGFFSAEDADSLPSPGASRKQEGAFYVWEKAEIMRILGPKDGEIFSFHYGVEPEGNAEQDPQGEFSGKNILYRAHTLEETAQRFDLAPDQVEELLAPARKNLFEVRSRRPRPSLDDKVLASWNGLMISAFARAYQVLGRPEDLAAALASARFLRDRLYDPGQRTLHRRWREGERQVLGMADDYAFLAQGLLDLYEASFGVEWLTWALDLTETLLKEFYDPENGGFYMTSVAHDKNLILRTREEQDDVEPSAAAVAVTNLLRLHQFTDRRDFREAAEKTLEAFGVSLKEQPRSFPRMLSSLLFSLDNPVQVILAGDPASEETARMLEVVHQKFMPHKILLLAEGGPRQEKLSSLLPRLQAVPVSPGKTAVSLCVGTSCRPPTSDPRTLASLLG